MKLPQKLILPCVVLLLAGCSAVSPDNSVNGQIPASAKTTITQPPSWEKTSFSSVDTLKSFSIQALPNDNKTLPDTFEGTTPDGSCSVTYSVVFISSVSTGKGDQSLSKNLLAQLGHTDEAKTKVKSVSIKDSKGNPLIGYESSFSYPNLIPEQAAPPATPSSTPPVNKTDGVVSSKIFVRAFDSVMANGASAGQINTPTKVDLTKGQPALVISYQCTKVPVKNNIWSAIIKTATANVAYGTK